MQFRKPEQPLIGNSVSGIEHKENRKYLRERKIECGNPPEQDEGKTPEAYRAMHIPIHPRKVRAPVHLQTAAPKLYTRPPNDRTGHAQERQTAAADAVHPKADGTGEKARVKF